MRNAFPFAIFLILSACAKQRNTPYYSPNQGQMKVGPVITSVLTNPNYDQQQKDKNNAQDAKPYTPPGDATLMDEDFEQKDLAVLYKSYQATEVTLPLPEGVICEFIPQSRIQKTIGRLSCTQQSPMVSDPVTIQNGTRYHCSVDVNKSEEFSLSDRLIYEGLNIEETIVENGNSDVKIFTKRIGRFHCEKEVSSGAPRYECSADTLVK